MLRCPICKSEMRYKNGESNGKKYEFYSCIRMECRGIIEIDEVDKYDDGIQPERVEKTLEEEGNDLSDILIEEGYSMEDALYAKHMWEKD